jgi:hypothetical protein
VLASQYPGCGRKGQKENGKGDADDAAHRTSGHLMAVLAT